MQRIFFDTKENNNRRREQEFLNLPPAERVMVFLRDVERFGRFVSHAPERGKDNFVVRKKQPDGV